MPAFEAAHPARPLLTAYMAARYAGQRRGDILKMARSCYSGGMIEVRQEKTDQPLIIPAHWRLKAHLDQLPVDLLLFVVDANGQPIEETAFSKQFRAALDAAGLNQLHFHGLRHTAGRALAEAGCSSHQIKAITGHKTLQMVEHLHPGRAPKTACPGSHGEPGGNENGTGKWQTRRVEWQTSRKPRQQIIAVLFVCSPAWAWWV